jgi:hypothetical protein
VLYQRKEGKYFFPELIAFESIFTDVFLWITMNSVHRMNEVKWRYRITIHLWLFSTLKKYTLSMIFIIKKECSYYV